MKLSMNVVSANKATPFFVAHIKLDEKLFVSQGHQMEEEAEKAGSFLMGAIDVMIEQGFSDYLKQVQDKMSELECYLSPQTFVEVYLLSTQGKIPSLDDVEVVETMTGKNLSFKGLPQKEESFEAYVKEAKALADASARFQ